MNPCRCGCGTLVRRQWHKGHNKRLPIRYTIDARTGCWEWQGAKNAAGYGHIKQPGTRRMVKAHRYVYELLVGPIPDGLQLDHLCRNRGCVNPTHLEPASNATNVQRGDSAKLVWDDVLAIRASSLTRRQLSTKYGVSMATISDVRSERTWKRSAA